MVRGVLWWRPMSSKGRRWSSTSPTPRSLGRRRQHPGGRAATLWGEEKDPRSFCVIWFIRKEVLTVYSRSAGMSKAVFSLQRSVRFQRAVLFAMINPQVGLSSTTPCFLYNCSNILISWVSCQFNLSFISQMELVLLEWGATYHSVKRILRWDEHSY